MEVSIERYVERVHGGNQYRGYVEIAGAGLEYELSFPVPIPQLDGGTESSRDTNEVRRLFRFTMNRDGEDGNVELTDEELGFFFCLLAPFAVGLHNSLRDDEPTPLFAASFSSGFYPLSPQLREMLSAPKFGCAPVA